MTTRTIRAAAIISLIAIIATTATVSNPRTTHAQGVVTVCDPDDYKIVGDSNNNNDRISIEPHPLGLRLYGCLGDLLNGGLLDHRGRGPATHVNLSLMELEHGGIERPDFVTSQFQWDNLRGTSIIEISEDRLPDGTNIGMIDINKFRLDRQGSGYGIQVRNINFQNIVYTRPGRLDILPTYDDVSWPGADFVRIMAQQGGVPARIVWVVIGFGLAFVALVAVGGATKSPLIGGIAGAVVLGLITTPTVGIATIGLLLIFLMCVAGVLVIGGFN